MTDPIDLARDMAAAIMRERTARSSSTVDRDGRQRVTFQHMQASHQLDEAMTAFCTAVGMPVVMPEQYSDAEALKKWTGHDIPQEWDGAVSDADAAVD
jgi:hypothetical protein